MFSRVARKTKTGWSNAVKSQGNWDHEKKQPARQAKGRFTLIWMG